MKNFKNDFYKIFLVVLAFCGFFTGTSQARESDMALNSLISIERDLQLKNENLVRADLLLLELSLSEESIETVAEFFGRYPTFGENEEERRELVEFLAKTDDPFWKDSIRGLNRRKNAREIAAQPAANRAPAGMPLITPEVPIPGSFVRPIHLKWQ